MSIIGCMLLGLIAVTFAIVWGARVGDLAGGHHTLKSSRDDPDES